MELDRAMTSDRILKVAVLGSRSRVGLKPVEVPPAIGTHRGGINSIPARVN